MEISQYNFVLDLKNLKSFRKKAFRDSYISGRARTSIALQIQGLREHLGLNQEKFAKKIGKPQSAVSRLENTGYGRVSVQTLLDIAEALDIAIVIKFTSFDEFLRQHGDVSPSALAVETYDETIERITNMVMLGPMLPDFTLQDVGAPSTSATSSVIWSPLSVDFAQTGLAFAPTGLAFAPTGLAFAPTGTSLVNIEPIWDI